MVDVDDSSRWVAQEKPGGIFCAPACGFDCKKVDYDRAVAAAEALAVRLGPPWRAHVWENCGWYWLVAAGDAKHHAGLFEIRERIRGDRVLYDAWFNGEDLQIIEDQGETPEDVLGVLVQRVRGAARSLDAACDLLTTAGDS